MKNIFARGFVRQFFVVFLFAMSAGAQASLQVAVDAYAEGNYTVALKELKPLAEKGDPKAQYLLATMYENGQGVTQDYGQALLLFNKSSEQGNDQAMLRLGGMHKSGLGVPVDFVLAHKWYNLAGASGNEYARHTMEAVEAKLTPKQVEKAKALAKEWLAKYKRK